MAFKNFAFVVGQSDRPLCKNRDCDIAENPEHHITVHASDWLLTEVGKLAGEIQTNPDKALKRLWAIRKVLMEAR